MGRRRSCMTIDKEEQLAKMKEPLKALSKYFSASFRPREEVSCKLLRIYGVVTWHYSFTSEDQQEATNYYSSKNYG